MAYKLNRDLKYLSYTEKHPISGNTIPDGFFKGNVYLKDVVIPEGIDRICTGTFEGCDLLTSVKIPATVKIIEHDAFAGCVELKEIIFSGVLEEVDCWFDARRVGKQTLSHPSSDKLIEYLKRGYPMDLYFEGDYRPDHWD